MIEAIILVAGLGLGGGSIWIYWRTTMHTRLNEEFQAGMDAGFSVGIDFCNAKLEEAGVDAAICATEHESERVTVH